MTLDVVNGENEKVGSLEVKDEVFGGRVNTEVIWESVVHENASQRRGTHATKNRGLVRGSGRKPWRQKGTGRARVGAVRSPLWRKGGTVFGPQPRSYGYMLPSKVTRGALRAALAQRMQTGRLVVVNELAIPEISTKLAVELLDRLGAQGKTLLVDVKPDDNLVLSRAQRRSGAGLGHGAADGTGRAGYPADNRDQGRGRTPPGGAGVVKLTDVIRGPLITEKSTILREDGRTIVFRVAARATKVEIKHAIEHLLGSKVESVRTSIMHGKVKRQGRFAGQRSDWKKAYVRLRDGERMPEFLEGA